MVCTKRKIRFGCLEKPLSTICYKYAWFVGAHPWIFILVPILITLTLSSGYFFKINLNNVNRLYIPQDGLSLSERAAILENFPQLDGSFTPSRAIDEEGLVSVLIVAQDGGSVLRPAQRRAVIKLNERISNDVKVNEAGVEYTYRNVCLRYNQFCHTNPQLYALDALLSNPGPYDQTSFPTVRHGSRRFYVGATLGGVELDPLTSQIVDAKAWQLIYRLNFNKSSTGDRNFVAAKSLLHVIERVLIEYDDDLLDVAVYHSETLDNEIPRNGENLVVRFAVCVVVLWTFSQLCAITTLKHDGAFYVDWTRSKFLVAGCGLLGAIMGVGSAVGFLAFCRYPYNSVCDAMPFLVLGVRLDNTFLMISAVHQTKRSLNAQERLAQAMSEAAVSITITVLTDILSFAIGLITDFMAVQMFSLYTVVAITITFVYQLTFLMGVLALSLRAEKENKHNLLPLVPIVPVEKHEDLTLFDRLFLIGTLTRINNKEAVPDQKLAVKRTDSIPSNVISDKGTWISTMIRTHYAPFLMKSWCRLTVFFIYAIYLAIAVYGCVNVRQGLEPIRLLVTDSYAIKFYHRLEQYFWKLGTQAQVVFTEVGDLSNATYRLEIMQIMNQFAESSHGMGVDGLDFWLVSFNHFLREYNGGSIDSIMDSEEFFTSIDYFLSLDENSVYRNDIRWNYQEGINKTVIAFRGVVGLRDFSTATQQMSTVDEFRGLAARYPAHGIITFSPMWLFVDQYEEVLPNTIQEIYGGVSFMVLIAIFFIPSLVCSLWVAIAILSIDAGVIGLMTFWEINLDVISMITIIMSIGFSVDFTAHVAYAYVVSEDEHQPGANSKTSSKSGEVTTNVRKTANALGNLAWPITQGAISTVMGVVVLSGTDSYVSTAFFRTVLLVITLGLVHALLFLPVALSVFSFKLSTRYLSNLFNFVGCSKKPKDADNGGKNNSKDDDGSNVNRSVDIELKIGGP